MFLPNRSLPHRRECNQSDAIKDRRAQQNPSESGFARNQVREWRRNNRKCSVQPPGPGQEPAGSGLASPSGNGMPSATTPARSAPAAARRAPRTASPASPASAAAAKQRRSSAPDQHDRAASAMPTPRRGVEPLATAGCRGRRRSASRSAPARNRWSGRTARSWPSRSG